MAHIRQFLELGGAYPANAVSYIYVLTFGFLRGRGVYAHATPVLQPVPLPIQERKEVEGRCWTILTTLPTQMRPRTSHFGLSNSLHQQCWGATIGTSRRCQKGDPHFCTVGHCAALYSAVQHCTVSHSATAWVPKSGIADVVQARHPARKTTYM